MNYGEERYFIIGFVSNVMMTVFYAERDDVTRIITARPASRANNGSMSKKDKDKEGTRWEELRSLTDEEILARALADPDGQPLSDEQLSTARRVPFVKYVRRTLDMTQEEFAERYQIPLGTLRDWEQGRTEPDQAAQAYLKVIAKEPETVSRALGTLGTRDAA